MSNVLDLELMTNGGQIVARFANFSIFYCRPTLSGVEFAFEFVYQGTEPAAQNKLFIDAFQIELSVILENQQEFYIGRFRQDVSEPHRLRAFESRFQARLELGHTAYRSLVDWTHHNSLDLRFQMKVIVKGPDDETNGAFATGDKRTNIPHSEWLEILNRGPFNRFETITISQPVNASSEDKEIFESAMALLKDAESSFNRGDWSGVGTKCRGSWRVFKTLIPKKDQLQAVELLLAPVAGDPRRKEFGEAMIKGLNAILNKATHLEGDSSANTLPVELSRADALLCLHWTSAVLSYLALVRS